MIRTSARRIVLFGLVSGSLIACGGKSAGPSTPTNGGGEDVGDAPATDVTPFDDEAVQQTLAAMAIPDACGGAEAGASLGALFAEQQQALGDGTEVDFSCRPDAGQPWDCMWSVMTVSSGAADPDDPCAGEGGGSGYQIMFKVDDAGAIVADSVGCIAPG